MKFAGIKTFAKVAKDTVVKYSPEILMSVGGATFIATVVIACKETVKEQEILETHEENLDYIDLMNEEGELDDKAWKKSRRGVYVNTIKETAVNYAPAVVVGTASIGCFFGAFGIMKKRYTTLLVAYTALEESFRKYRERVIAARGADEDIYYLTGNKPKEITVKDEEGNKKKVKQLELPDGTIASPYAFKFGKYKENGERNKQWIDEPQLLLSYACGQEGYANDRLYTRCVFDDDHNVVYRGTWMLNETRELCGEDPSSTGAVVGNRYGNGEPGCNGYIKWNIMESTEIDPDTGKKIPCLFINPNVDGLIYDLIGVKEKKPFPTNYIESDMD